MTTEKISIFDTTLRDGGKPSGCSMNCRKRSGWRIGWIFSARMSSKPVSDSQCFDESFSIGEFSRYCLLNGFDDIALTMRHKSSISVYENKSLG